MMFTFYTLEGLYSNHCHFMGWSESHMTKPEDAEVMFVLDTNRTVISQFEAVVYNQRALRLCVELFS